MTMFRAQTRAPLLAALGGTLLLAACGPKAPPARLPAPPPPKVTVIVPPRPTPPNNASDTIVVPPADASGLRVSVNRNITPAQTVWNLRSAYNVAALNCRAAEHGEILANYRAFLKTHSKGLAKANKAVDAEFKGKYGAAFIAPRESYMTEVYNHFALPPTMSDFCSAVLAVSRDGRLVKPAELEAFAQRGLPSIEVVFDDFYRRYEAYRMALAEWNAKYGPPQASAVGSAPSLVLPAPEAGAVRN